MEVREILRQIRAGESDHAIRRNLGVHRSTVKKYREWAAAEGMLEGELPPVEELQSRLAATLPDTPPPRQLSSVEPYRIQVEKLRGEGVRISAIYAEDEEKKLRKSHDNPAIAKLYEEFLGKPLGERSHHLLHTEYSERERV